MAEIRCPMCSKPNPEDAEVCSFCGARLKPLVGGPGEAGEPLENTPAESGDEAVPDWLERIRTKAREDQAEDEPEPASDEEAEGAPDWLSRLRQAEPLQEEGPPEGNIPEWLDDVAEQPPEEEEPRAASGAPETGWLDRLRAHAQSDAEEASAELSVSPEEVLGEFAAEGEPPDSADWLSEFEEAAEPEAATGQAAEGVSPWAEYETPPEAEEDQAAGPSGSGAEAGGSEGWLEDLAGEGSQGELPGWISELTEPSAEESVETGEALAAEGRPDEGGGASIETGSMGRALPHDEEEAQAFDWDEVAFDWQAENPEQPEGAAAEEAPPDSSELPHVPALILDQPEQPTTAEIRDFDLSAIELPDWLSEVRGESGEGEGRGNLAPATIPSWLEAMRPVETFQPVVDIEPEEEQAVESVGPLAGLRGVLLAEPVVAKPRTATSSGARLEVTERQFAQAELLQRIVSQEEHEMPAAAAVRRPWPIARWVISLVMMAAVFIPAVTGGPIFAIPQRVSRDLGPLVGIVNTLPVDRPVLLIFDYEPGYSGELNAVAEPLIENLMARGINIVTLSTRPTGPPLAVNLINQIGAPYQVEEGRNVLHLGYLSGGPTAVQLFSAAPREAILKGFMTPPDLAGQSPWASPLLADVQRLSDFGMVAVIAAGTDTARTWAEQAHPWMGNTPLVMVLSQGAEPLIRPYFESLTPQVNGILSGLPTAVAYEQLNGRQGLAFARWNGFGAGSLAAELIILAGLGYGLAAWFMGRRRA
jgi:hypothetical protein